MAVGSGPQPPLSRGDELGTITVEIQRLGGEVRERLHQEQDWTVRTLGLVLIATTLLQSFPFLAANPPAGVYQLLDALIILFTLGTGTLLLVVPRGVREGFARWFRLRPPPDPQGSGGVAGAIRQILVNDTEIQEISTLGTLTSLFLVIIAAIAIVVGVVSLTAWAAFTIGGFAVPWLIVAGLAASAIAIAFVTIAIVRWRRRSLGELDRQNAHRGSELARVQQELWQRY
jgi:hypothetical protein